jgi:hypothetical protein
MIYKARKQKKENMKHVKLFESFGSIPERGIAEFELKDGVGMLVYDIQNVERMMELYNEFNYDNQFPFEEFLKEMSTPGIYGKGESGGPWEVIEIGTDFSGFLDKGRYFGMIYRF